MIEISQDKTQHDIEFARNRRDFHIAFKKTVNCQIYAAVGTLDIQSSVVAMMHSVTFGI